MDAEGVPLADDRVRVYWDDGLPARVYITRGGSPPVILINHVWWTAASLAERTHVVRAFLGLEAPTGLRWHAQCPIGTSPAEVGPPMLDLALFAGMLGLSLLSG